MALKDEVSMKPASLFCAVLIFTAGGATATSAGGWSTPATQINGSAQAALSLAVDPSDCCNGPSSCNACFSSSCCSGPGACGMCMSKKAANKVAPASNSGDIHPDVAKLTHPDLTITGHLLLPLGSEGSSLGLGVKAHLLADTELGQVHFYFKSVLDNPTDVHMPPPMPGAPPINVQLKKVEASLTIDIPSHFASLRFKSEVKVPGVEVAFMTPSACLSVENIHLKDMQAQMAMGSAMFTQKYTQFLNGAPRDEHSGSDLVYHTGPAKLFVSKSDGMPTEVKSHDGYLDIDWKALPSGYDGFHFQACSPPADTSTSAKALQNRQDVQLLLSHLNSTRMSSSVLEDFLPMDLFSLFATSSEAKTAEQTPCMSCESDNPVGPIIAAFSVGTLAAVGVMKSLDKRHVEQPRSILG